MRLATLAPGEPELFTAPQGEGPSAGTLCVFLRLSQCNLHCIWCDTPYTWNFTGTDFPHRDDRPGRPAKYDRTAETVDADVEGLVERLLAQPVRRLVLTGGEPLLQQAALGRLIEQLKAADTGWTVEVETNGTVGPRGRLWSLVDQFNVSPKLAHSGNAAEIRERSDVLAAYAGDARAVFKFVVEAPGDLDEVGMLMRRYGLPKGRVWLMPEGRDSATLRARLDWLVPAASAMGVHLSDRLHIHTHGDTRGT